jgi:hypothetical protein
MYDQNLFNIMGFSFRENTKEGLVNSSSILILSSKEIKTKD